MRLVVWNVAKGFAKDAVALRVMGCDVGVLVEVPKKGSPTSTFDSEVQWRWTGNLDVSGLAVAGFGRDVTLVSADSSIVCLAAETDGLRILGIAAAKHPDVGYAGSILQALEQHGGWLGSGPAIVAGDFNTSLAGKQDKYSDLRREVFQRLGELGFTSLYHALTGEDFGAESVGTYYHWYKEGRPFHIDYVFANDAARRAVRSFSIGDFDTRVPADNPSAGRSDHVPIVVDFDTSVF